MIHQRKILFPAICALAWISAAFTSQSHALVLNDEYFTLSGGDVNNVAGTLDAGYADARAYSVEEQFLAVGNIGGICTSTWLGNAPGNKTYVLTAAHCVEGSGHLGSISTSFTDWEGNQSFLSGIVHLPPERYDPDNFGCGGGACSDIAVVELDGQINIQDASGQPVTAPMIYDRDKESGFENTFVGYGSWGIGSQGSNGGLFPSSGQRRAAGTNVINGFFESDKGIGTIHDAPGTGNFTPRESAVAPGDSGSGWWQQHLGEWTVIATTNGGSGSQYGGSSTGARVSQYADWIDGIYPDVRRYSEEVLIGDINLDGQITADLSGNDDFTAFIDDWRSASVVGDIKIADLNEDRVVDLLDFGIFRQAVVNAGGAELSFDALFAAVPEPGSMSLVACALGVTMMPRRTRNSRESTEHQ